MKSERVSIFFSAGLWLLALCAAASTLAWIFFYNQIVTLRHESRVHTTLLQDLEVKNAGLKNDLYALIDFKDPEAVSLEFNLIHERNPEYLTMRTAGGLAQN